MTTITPDDPHTLVSAEYTMPDGSKRRGLWGRVPECKPAISFHHPSDGHWWIDDSVLLAPRELHVGAATALIRVAIEDWERKRLLLEGPQTMIGAYLSEACRHSLMLGCFTAVSFEDVVLTAHVVADSLGVPH